MAAENLVERQFTAVYQKRGRWYIAYVEEIPGVNTQGCTRKEAKQNLREALELVLESTRTLSRHDGDDSTVERESIAVKVPAVHPVRRLRPEHRVRRACLVPVHRGRRTKQLTEHFPFSLPAA